MSEDKLKALENRLSEQERKHELLRADFINLQISLNEAINSLNGIKNNGLGSRVRQMGGTLDMQNLRIKKLERNNGSKF